MARPQTITPTLRRQRLGDKAYERIKRDIILCKLSPGSEVTETSLARHYGFGLSPIRTALSRLCQDGLVNAIPRRGYLITPITTESVHEIFELRLLLEPAAARAAAGRVDETLLRRLSGGPYDESDTKRMMQFLQDNQDFHIEIARAAGNSRLSRIIASLLDEMGRLLHLGLFSKRDAESTRIDHELQRNQHEALVEALVAGDGQSAEQAMRKHIEHSYELVQKVMMNGWVGLRIE